MRNTMEQNNNELVYINFIEITRETEKAICIRIQATTFDYTVWVPKSQVNEIKDNNVRLPKWLAKRVLFGEDYQKAKRYSGRSW